MLDIRNFGQKSIQEVKNKVIELGLSFKKSGINQKSGLNSESLKDYNEGRNKTTEQDTLSEEIMEDPEEESDNESKKVETDSED